MKRWAELDTLYQLLHCTKVKEALHWNVYLPVQSLATQKGEWPADQSTLDYDNRPQAGQWVEDKYKVMVGLQMWGKVSDGIIALIKGWQ